MRRHRSWAPVGSPVQQMRDELLGMVAHFHAVVDFPDEDIDPVLFEDAAALLHRTTSRLYSMAKAMSAAVFLEKVYRALSSEGRTPASPHC